MSPSTPSLTPLIAVTKDLMKEVNTIIINRMQSEIDLIPTLAGHLVASGGKRMRPMLTLAGGIMAMPNLDKEKALHLAYLAAAVEFIHTATLLHDDVIDASTMRRGEKTANALWGNEASVLVGDFLFARAFELMVETGHIGVLGRLAGVSAQITEGEISQMLIAGKPDTSIDGYLRMIRGKTAELFAAAAEVGGMVTGCNEDINDGLRSYGLNLGIAFQITDDALDYSADEIELGKTVGDDFAEGKITLPIIIAYQHGNEEEKKFWQNVMSREDENTAHADEFSHAQKLLTKYDAIQHSLNKARHYAEKAEASLQNLPANPARAGLIEAARFAVARTH